MAGIVAVLSPEKRIESNPFDIDAWNLLLREVQKQPADSARPFYERLVGQFPNAGRYWRAFIEHELRAKNYENVEKLFGRSLVKVLNIDLWKCYLCYVRETKGHMTSFREKMAQAYDFAIEKVGLDMNSYQIYAEYVSFLKSVRAIGSYAENQKIAAVRKVFQKGVVTPIVSAEQLWAEYCGFEKTVNATLAEKLIQDRYKDFQTAKRVTKEMESVTRGLNRQAVSVPPRATPAEMKQLNSWKKYIAWEKSNPLQTEDHALFARRVVYAYEQALLCLGYYPDVWYEAALFMQEASRTLADRGDARTAQQLNEDVAALYERVITTLLKDNPLLYFAYADYEEERMRFQLVEQIYQRFVDLPHVDPTLAYIQLMKFSRRTEGIKTVRAVFKRAREDTRCQFHVYVAAALTEYYCSKDTAVAIRIFELGLKKFGDEPDFALAFIDFLSHLNEDNNTRVLFERILTSGSLPTERSLEVWDRYLAFESQVGDLPSILKVDRRRRQTLDKEFHGMQTLLLIDRYKFLDLVPCTAEQLRLLGHSGTGAQRQPTGASGTGANDSAPSGNSAVGSARAKNMGMGTTYPRPDVSQMLPFKPKITASHTFHAVPGGVFPAPPAAAHLLQMLPPPWCFGGPFVGVDALMDRFRDFRLPDEPPRPPCETAEDNGAPLSAAAQQRLDGVKKEMYQLVATTPDPMQLISQDGWRPTTKRPARAMGDSDDESDAAAPPMRDVYRLRQQSKRPVL